MAGVRIKNHYDYQGKYIEFWTRSPSGKATNKIENMPERIGQVSRLIEYKTINEGSIQADVAKFYLIGEGEYMRLILKD